jgi:putative ABC transport system ATP-binding protein
MMHVMKFQSVNPIRAKPLHPSASMSGHRRVITKRPTTSIRASGIDHSYDDKGGTAVILKGVSLHIAEGDFCLLRGNSGSGKSTLLAILSGLLKPRKGQLMVLDCDLWKLQEHERESFRQRHFGFVFQSCHLFPALTARQQLELVLRWGEGESTNKARQRAEQMLEQRKLGDKLDRLPAELSGGEKQRVAIGRALVKRPAICFADEPTSALDPAHAKEAMELFKDAAHHSGTTVVLISHDEKMQRYADRAWTLEKGHLQEFPTHPHSP